MTDLRSELEEDLDQVLGEQHSSAADDRLLTHELRVQRVRIQARDILAAERRGDLPPIDTGTVSEILQRPAEPRHRVEGLMPWSASTLLTAQRKAGKTTTVLNLARSLLTGEDFLGRFGVRSVDGMVALLNFEVSAAQLAHWAADVGLPRDRLLLVNVRGRRNPLVDREDRGALTKLLRARGVESVLVDPFGRAYSGTSQNDAGEVGSWLTQLDQWARSDVGANDLVLTAHAGWNAERTRGSTALEDWADSIVTLTKDESEDSSGERYLRAIGRDVDVDEDQLQFDASTRLLTMIGAGSRKVAGTTRRLADLDQEVLAVIVAQPGLNGVGLGKALRDAGVSFRRGEEYQSARRLVTSGQVTIQPGPRGANLYYPSSSPGSPAPPPTSPVGDLLTSPAPPYIGGRSQGTGQEPELPQSSCAICSEPMAVVEPGQTTHPGCDPS